jgi:glycolate oxidase iron-sulfur subunit
MITMTLDQCVHCGLCLSSCPTYQQTGVEMESPRGRLVLLALWAKDSESHDAVEAQWLDDCLDCRACEAVCPAHVPTGHLVEEWRERQAGSPPSSRLMRLLTFFLGSPQGLTWFQRFARWSQHPLGRALVRRWLTWWPDSPVRLQRGLPARINRRLSRHDIASDPPHSRTAFLFVGCVMDAVYADTNQHTADLLRMAGYRVTVDLRQRCCGALHWHNGQPAQAQKWARENIEAFEASGASVIVLNAAGCLSTLREYPELLRGTPWEARAHHFSAAVRDALEVLSDEPLPDLPEQPTPVTIHDACHHVHAQGIFKEPRILLQRAGYRIQEMTNSTRCCGSAGIYNLTHPEMSQALLRDKIDGIPQGVDIISAANPGCLLHIQQGLVSQGKHILAEHPIDLAWRAYRAAGYLQSMTTNEGGTARV